MQSSATRSEARVKNDLNAATELRMKINREQREKMKKHADEMYETRLRIGVAKEEAERERKDYLEKMEQSFPAN